MAKNIGNIRKKDAFWKDQSWFKLILKIESMVCGEILVAQNDLL